MRLTFLIPLRQANDADFLDDLENNMRPDLCITAAYGQYLPKRFLAIPKLGTQRQALCFHAVQVY